MWDSVTEGLLSGPEVPLEQLVKRLSLAFVMGCVISGLYVFTRRSSARPTPNLASTLILLAILIAIVSQVIGESIARAFSLVGALSIIRFRTLVEDTRDLAFVIFAVVIGMAVGVGHPEVAIMGLIITGVATIIFRPGAGVAAGERWTLSVRVGAGAAPELPLQEVFAKHLESSRLMSSSTSRQGSALDLVYQVRLRPASTATAFATELNLLAGLQNVEMRRI